MERCAFLAVRPGSEANTASRSMSAHYPIAATARSPLSTPVSPRQEEGPAAGGPEAGGPAAGGSRLEGPAAGGPDRRADKGGGARGSGRRAGKGRRRGVGGVWRRPGVAGCEERKGRDSLGA